MNSSLPTTGINWINIKMQKREFLVVIHTLPPRVPVTCRGLQLGPSFVLCGAVLSTGKSGASGARGSWIQKSVYPEHAGLPGSWRHRMSWWAPLETQGVQQGPVRR